MKANKPIIVLTGPTGSGKTALSLEIAKEYGCEIICADSTTVYSGMDIGTDKPTLDPTTKVEDGHYFIHGIRHHMLDRFAPNEEFNVSLFVDIVGYEIEQIEKRGNIPLLVGGSLLYIDALVYNYQLPPVAPNEKLRFELEKLETPKLYEKLCELAPDAENTIDQYNRRRIIRAIEVVTGSGKPFLQQKTKSPLPSNVLYLAIDKDRVELYKNIDKRVDQMFVGGFVEEVKGLLTKYRGSTALQTTGYKQISEFLDGKITLGEAIDSTKQAHRNYAKRQLTWLRKNPDVKWVKNIKEADSLIFNFLKL